MAEKLIIETTSADATEQLGVSIGENLKGGEIIELRSDLGGGKTTFTRGLAKGAGSADQVASPTFTISKVYICPTFEIHHFDFYRLQEAGLMEHELTDLIDDPKVVIVVEWGDVVQHVLPDKRVTIEIQQIDAEARHIHISAHPSLNYLIEESKKHADSNH